MSFDECGYGSRLLIGNISFVVWVIILHLILLILYCLIALLARTCRCLVPLKDKLAGYFFWNGLIRFSTEFFLDLMLASVLNVRMADW